MVYLRMFLGSSWCVTPHGSPPWCGCAIAALPEPPSCGDAELGAPVQAHSTVRRGREKNTCADDATL